MDAESYVHRIGRTGRAGRAGRALLFVENRERRLLRNIERTMKLTIPEVELPDAEMISQRRRGKFAATIHAEMESSNLDQYRALLKNWFRQTAMSLTQISIWKLWLLFC